MALADVTLADGQSTPVNHVFSYVGTTNGSRVVRANLSATPEAPEHLSIDHKTVTKGGIQIDSHLVRVDLTVLDTDDAQTPYALNGRMMFDVPRRILSDAVADNLAAFLRNFATSANIRALLRGSVL